jgi:EAL domain-containing protein (putative c-di-GMP-specific phosphodiesterase class I)
VSNDSAPIKECFVVSPIGAEGSDEREHADAVLQTIIRPAAARLDLHVVRADQIADPGNITDQVVTHLVEAAIVVADLTFRNPNVFWELGVRHAFGLPVVLLARDGELLPFDVAAERVIFLTLGGGAAALTALDRTVDRVEQSLARAMSGSHSGPVLRATGKAASLEQPEAPITTRDLDRAMAQLRSDLAPDQFLAEIGVITAELRSLRENVGERETEPLSGGEAAARFEMLQSVERARLGEGLEVFGQAIWNLHTGEAEGVELLMRLRDGSRRLHPSDFLIAVSDAGLLPKLSMDWLRAAASKVEDAANLDGLRRRGGFLSVNVGRELASDEVGAGLAALRDSFPGRLMIEVSESDLVTLQSQPLLRAMRERGFELAVDDFGTGYSSLAYLRAQPLHTIKIDRSFVDDLARRDKAAVVGAVISLASVLGLSTVADGVESGDQLDALRHLGCQLAQGHYLGPAAPLAELQLDTAQPWA